MPRELISLKEAKEHIYLSPCPEELEELRTELALRWLGTYHEFWTMMEFLEMWEPSQKPEGA